MLTGSTTWALTLTGTTFATALVADNRTSSL
jgi:hypothetical protein